jgi:hypothetical protein
MICADGGEVDKSIDSFVDLAYQQAGWIVVSRWNSKRSRVDVRTKYRPRGESSTPSSVLYTCFLDDTRFLVEAILGNEEDAAWIMGVG